MNRNFCHCQPIEKCPAECVETEISKTQHQAIKRKCWLLTQRHRFLDDSWSDQLPPLICRRIPFRSVKWTTNRWTEEKGVPFGIGRPEIEKQNKTKQPKKNITNGLTCRIDPMTERLSRPPRCVSKSRSCGNRLRATSGGFGRDLPPVVKSDAIQSNGESLGNAETKLPACRGRSSVFSVQCWNSRSVKFRFFFLSLSLAQYPQAVSRITGVTIWNFDSTKFYTFMFLPS